MLVNTGFVISIALAIGLMTSAMDPKVLVAVFSGTQTGASGIDLGPFINALHIAFGAGLIASLFGAGISLMRGGHRSWVEEAVDHEALAAESVIGDAEAGASI